MTLTFLLRMLKRENLVCFLEDWVAFDCYFVTIHMLWLIFASKLAIKLNWRGG